MRRIGAGVAFVLGSAFTLVATPVLAESGRPESGGLMRRLEAGGYADIGMTVRAQVLEVAVTNGTWWRPARAVGEILLAMAEEAPGFEGYRIVLQRDRQSVFSVEVARAVYVGWLSGAIGDEELLAGLRVARGNVSLGVRTRDSRGWFDLGVAPTYTLANGLGLGVAGQGHALLADGLACAFEGQMSLAGASMPPLDSAQVFAWGWIGTDLAWRAAAGTYGRSGAGALIGLSRPLGEGDFRLQAGATAAGPSWATAVAAWPLALVGATAKLELGQYLDGDAGGVASLLWAFERTRFEAAALVTTSGVDLRTVLALDLAGPRRVAPGPFRLMAGEVFVPYQADRATRARRPSYVDPFDRLWLDATKTEMAGVLKEWPKAKPGP